MNTKQQNILRSLLKKYQYKDVSNRVHQGMGINFEAFLVKTEPLYVIPRIASCYAEDDKRGKLMNHPYKEWLKDVVEKGWVKPINKLTEEHGERVVLSAIYYLMDNNLWEVYKGRLALDASESTYYDKLQDMPSAIAKVKEINSDLNKEESQEEVKEETTPATPEPIVSAEEAIKCANGADIAIEALIDNIHKMTEYVRTAADTDGLRSKLAEQQRQMEEIKEQHQKKVTELEMQIDELKAKADEANKTMLKASDFISKQKEEIKDMERNYDILNEKYNKALDERDAADRDLEACKKLLDEEAQKDKMPKKKVIPKSAIEDVPLLGRGVMKGLVPVLTKYNVVIDPNR